MKISGLILAAGNSSRLGQAKQLLQHHKQSLLGLVETTLAKHVGQIYTVLGSQHQRMVKELTQSKVVINPDWQKGMGTSLRIGFQQASQQADGVLVALCDQPMISASHYQKMIETAINHPYKIIASGYAGIIGAPVIFTKQYAQKIQSLTDESGAQNLLKQFADDVLIINCPAASIDIDKPEDLKHLR